MIQSCITVTGRFFQQLISAVMSFLNTFSSLFVFFCSSVVHKEGFVLFIISSLIYMLMTCRLWKSIKKYSLSPEVRNAKSHTHTADRNYVICSTFMYFIAGFFFLLLNRIRSLTVGKCVCYFSMYFSVLLPDSFIGNTTCTVSQGVSRLLNQLGLFV